MKKRLLTIGCALLTMLLFTCLFSSKVEAAEKQQRFCYLSDIPHQSAQVGWKTLTKDRNLDGGTISLRVNGETRKFLKGVVAHATSTVVYDISDYDYDYFTSYLGIEATKNGAGDGVKFTIYTSTDGQNWENKTPELDNVVMRSNEDAVFVTIDIRGAKYIKLYANRNRNDNSDHATYANAKLIKEGYEETTKPATFIKTIEEYDALIKPHYEAKEEITGEYEKLLLQRELVNCVGYEMIQMYAGLGDDRIETLEWLFSDLENLQYYIIGGKPELSRTFDPTTQRDVNANENYISSLNVLNRMYHAYKADFEIEETTKYGTRLGDLYKRMAMAISLTHSRTVGLWMQASVPENVSDPVERYKIYKELHKNNKFFVKNGMDVTEWFEKYTVEEMRLVMNNPIDNEEIVWLNEYTQSFIDSSNGNLKYITPHPYIAYVSPNYNNPIFHDEGKKDEWDQLFKGIFTKYNVSYSSNGRKILKVWMNMRNPYGTGCVCGGISKTGSNIRGVHGIASTVVSQPGHAALIYYTRNSQGKGYWSLDNDVSGWAQSGRTESLNNRMPLGYGNQEYIHFHQDWLGMATYVLLAQGALNDFDNYQTSRETLILADVYQENNAEKKKIYRDVVNKEPLNIDGWYGLIKAYRADENTTEEDYLNLSKEIMANLKYYPLPMYHLAREVKKNITSPQYDFSYNLELNRTLVAAKNATANDTLQKQAVNQVANRLLGLTDNTMATFSFDGNDAGKIVLAERYDGTGIRWDYSLDGKQTWTPVEFTAEEEHKLLLSKRELDSITAENDIYIHVVGVGYEEENLYKIDILESAGLPSTLYANDWENKMIAATSTMEWKLSQTGQWTSFDTMPDLTGDKKVWVRMRATGTHLVGEEVEYTFTQDEVNNKRKYISIDHLSIHGYSTQSLDNKRPFYAPNAIDGNMNTLWHTDFSKNVLQSPDKPFISIKLDAPRNLSALEFTQRKYPGRPQDPDDIRNARVYVSMDGESWIEAGKIENCATYGELYAINFERPVYGQYVKIEMDTTNMFASLALVNLYEDTTIVTLATFSFDGENAGKIVLVKDFKDSSWEYSLDGGTTWKTGSGNAHTLSVSELKQITAENKIKVRLKTDQKESTIEIQRQEIPNITAYRNDLENRLIGITNIENLEWRVEPNTETTQPSEEQVWTSYAEEEPVVQGDTKLIIRKKATGILTASEPATFVFTEDNQPATAKYVSIKHIASVNVSNTTEGRGEPGQKAIDGLPTTMWHSNRTTTTMHDPRWIVLELDEPRYISKIEYVRKDAYLYGIPRDGIVSVSMDGETWTEVLNFKNLYDATSPEELAASDNQKELVLTKIEKAKYVKIECTKSCDDVHGVRDGVPMDYFFSAAMINLFEDTTKIEIPRADVEYDITELTNQNVTARLVNKSTEITVTNNEGKDTHTFTDNGTFTFEFVDSKGTKGSATAKVTWICKTLPVATITYSTESRTNQDVTANITFDRDVRILNEAGEETETILKGERYTYTFTQNGKHKIRFVGPYGNESHATAEVTWIDKDVPVAKIEYSSTNQSNQDVTATITFEDKEEHVTVEGGNTHTFTQNGTHVFNFVDEAGNRGSATAEVTWINKSLPTATVTYDITTLTNQDVMATVTFDAEGVTVEDSNEYIFRKNEKHIFKFVDAAGNKGEAVAEVTWIDKDAPVGIITYSNTNLTNKDVTATLTFEDEKEEVTITNNGGKNTYTFPINGEFTFEFVDKAGNKGTATAEVEWIDKRQINAEITYDINDITNKNVTATITFDKENVWVDGGATHVFTENGTHEFYFIGPAGNEGRAIAEVTWIDKTPPNATITYSTKNPTNQDVTATITFDEGGVTIVDQNNRPIQNGDTYVFTNNGVHEFRYIGPVGNIGTATAEVTWIDKEAPTAQVQYSTQNPTNQDVVATLVNASEEITITNNHASNVYTFSEDGEFIFEFVDKVGNKGTAKAKVNWIDKVAPTAEIQYSTQETTKGNVTATLVNASEEITITNNHASNVYTFIRNGEFTFEFVDKAGNKGTAKATVTWIDKPDGYEIGDVNADGKITATDLLLLKRHLVAGKTQEWILTGERFKAGDLNEDGKITATDLLLMKRLVLEHMKLQLDGGGRNEE